MTEVYEIRQSHFCETDILCLWEGVCENRRI
jgi:hypothetical protein